ncbi:MAG: TlpA family protein disulfide reductase [Chthoniobacterales bacterium]
MLNQGHFFRENNASIFFLAIKKIDILTIGSMSFTSLFVYVILYLKVLLTTDTFNPLSNKVGEPAPDFSFISAEEKVLNISDFRGKWLLIQFGATNCKPSEITAQYFSQMRKAMTGRPFEFVEIYNDPTLTDVELYSVTDFHGIRALANKKNIPRFYKHSYIPVWFLIDPGGILRASGDFEDAPTLQKILLGHLANAKGFEGLSLTVTPEEAKYNKLILASLRDMESHKKLLTGWEDRLTHYPNDIRAIRGKARAIGWLNGGYPAANKYLSETLAKMKNPPIQLQTFDILYKLSEGTNLSTVKQLETLSKTYPKSIYLKADNSIWTRLPEDLTMEEILEIKEAWKKMPGRHDYFKNYLANAFYAQGDKKQALEILLEEDPALEFTKNLSAINLLHRIGKDEEALNYAAPPNDNYTPETATAKQAWLEVLRYTVLEDWPQVETYAQRYEATRPQKALGPLLQWLAALRLNQPEKIAKAKEKAMQVLNTSPRYDKTHALLNTSFTRNDLILIKDVNNRLDIALAAILLAETEGNLKKTNEIRRTAVLALPLSEIGINVIQSLTPHYTTNTK